MSELGAGIIVAMGGAAVLAALAFRYLVESLSTLNRELQLSVQEQRASTTEREKLENRIQELEFQLLRCQQAKGDYGTKTEDALAIPLHN
jgi:hypothetical protein